MSLNIPCPQNSNGTAFYSDGARVSEELQEFRGSLVNDDYDCVALHPTGGWQWTKTQCVVAAHFICEYPGRRSEVILLDNTLCHSGHKAIYIFFGNILPSCHHEIPAYYGLVTK